MSEQEAAWIAQATLLIGEASKYMVPFPTEIDQETITPLGVPVSKMVGEITRGAAEWKNVLPLALEYSIILHGVLQAAYALGHKAGMERGQAMAWATSPSSEASEGPPSASSQSPEPRPEEHQNPSPADPPRS